MFPKKRVMDEQSIFIEALQRSSDERDSFLQDVCADDLRLRHRVERLLAAHEDAADFMDQPAGAIAHAVEVSITEAPGTLIGPYKLLELIGEGGFGNVYMAEQQEPVRRKVALKIIKLGMDTRQVIARFEAERQAVALMDHPNIAKVLDAGATETGRPYFVMELVRGVPITEYCDTNNLPTCARLQLFVDVCRAVQHAHQKGIIHRDLKPNNVLVTQQDGQPVPKIIDFGVAKATQQRLTEKTLFTEHRQLVGTPEYMSPEQATFCESDVDTRSDIYSLGVLLYELLVGATPFDGTTLRQRGYDEICRVIRESEPPTPSKRLSTIGPAAATDISKHRHAEPAALRKLLRGDLDWIVMKCLEKQRARRYETAHSLARDVERHLSDEPVQARPPSAGYQLQKFVRKHRGTVTAVFAVGVALILGLLMTSIGFLRAERERQIALSEKDRADENSARAEVLARETRRQLYVSDLNSAYHAWDEGNVDRVCELLKRHIPMPGEEDRRGFAWRYLWGQYQRALEIPTLRHGPVTSVAFSPDGNTLAATGWESKLKLWDVATLSEVRTLEQGSGGMVVAFSPDGKILASAGRPVQLLDSVTGKQLAQLPVDQKVNAIAFSPDGEFLAAACGEVLDGEVKLWDVTTRVEIATLTGHSASVTTVAFSPNGKVLASGGRDHTIKLWNVESRVELATLVGHTAEVKAVAFSSSGKAIASGGSDGRVILWDADDRRIVAESASSIRTSTCLVFSPTGDTLAVGTADSRVWFWDVATGRKMVHRTGHTQAVSTIAFSPDGASLATGSRDGIVQIATVPQFAEATAFSTPQDLFSQLAVSPVDVSLLVVGTGGIVDGAMTGELILWDTVEGKARTLVSDTQGRIDGVAFSPKGQVLAASKTEGAWGSSVVKLWGSESGTEVSELEVRSSPVFAMAFSPDGTILATADWGNASGETPPTNDWGSTIKLWDVETGQLRKSVPTFGFAAGAMEFSPDGQLLAIGGGRWNNGEVKLWDLSHDEGPVTLTHVGRGVWDVAFSPDGRLLACADLSNTVMLWGVGSRKLERAFNVHSFSAVSIAFSPDGKNLASGGRDRTVRLWHVATGGELATLESEMPVDDVEFFPDGNTLVASCMDKSIVLWHVDAEKEVLRAQSE